jgi:hypothetical protein
MIDKKLKAKLPLTYHYMITEKVKEVSELNFTKKFSESKKHQSAKYLQTNHYKPISLFFVRD